MNAAASKGKSSPTIGAGLKHETEVDGIAAGIPTAQHVDAAVVGDETRVLDDAVCLRRLGPNETTLFPVKPSSEKLTAALDKSEDSISSDGVRKFVGENDRAVDVGRRHLHRRV